MRDPMPISMLLVCGAIAVGAVGCCGDDLAVRDERSVRQLLGLPDEIRLVSLDSIPKSAGMQREGLRIDALFQLSSDQRDRFRARLATEFRPVPVPSCVKDFQTPPPTSMLGASTGYFVCRVSEYRPNSNVVAATEDCCASSRQFQSYALSTYDDVTGELRVWSKNYF